MVNEQAILDHLRELHDALSDLRRYREAMADASRLAADRDMQHMVLHAMLVSIQSSIDIANHLISEKRLKRPDTYRETFEILGQSGIIDASMGANLSNLAAFRNILVHGYWKLDQKTVFVLLQEDIWELEAFERVIKEILGKERG
jgi:uncharacterized protein YutE (UPF0331/DUF86 family)